MKCYFCNEESVGSIEYHFAYFCEGHREKARELELTIPQELEKIKKESKRPRQRKKTTL